MNTTYLICDNRIMELRLGEKFKLIKKIGSGAFGEIYKGKAYHICHFNN
jgi:hypothetical protein